MENRIADHCLSFELKPRMFEELLRGVPPFWHPVKHLADEVEELGLVITV